MRVYFSSRSDFGHGENAVSLAAAVRRAAGLPLLDLTRSNPGDPGLGLEPDVSALLALGTDAVARYEPTSFGLDSARSAVSDYYADHGVTVDPSCVVLSASTSEAYGWLFTVLGGPGETVLVPSPSYPLFGTLAQLAGIVLRPYRSVADVERGLAAGAVAVIVVHPNNPTGLLVAPHERRSLSGLCARHGATLIADEVFLDYTGVAGTRQVLPTTFASEADCLTVTLSGLSKVCGLPGLKAGWMVVSGPTLDRTALMGRLDHVADAYLSVGMPVQLALPGLLASRRTFQARVKARLADSWGLVSGVASVIDGGWCAPVPVRESAVEAPPGEATAMALLADGVLVHPGYLFGYDEPVVVLSLLTPVEVLSQALPTIVRRARGAATPRPGEN